MSQDEKRTRIVSSIINETIGTMQAVLADPGLLKTAGRIAEEIARACRSGGKVLVCGNGGSAADAQHMAAELSGRFFFDRQPLCVEALHVNTSYLTAVANDYSYEEVFSRLIRAQGHPGDVLVALSTSGSSVNIIRALEEANLKEMTTIGFTGRLPRAMGNLCDHLLKIPSGITPRIQECHMALAHIICEMVEHELFSIPRPAVFLDRDGVINRKMEDGKYVEKWSQFTFLPNVSEAVRLLNDHGYLVIVATNQQCVGKGTVRMETIGSIHEKMSKSIEKNGARIDAVYVCPHRAGDGCSCRKPNTGLFEFAERDFRRRGILIDMTKSYMIGDSLTDMLAGKKAGMGTIRVASNHPGGMDRGGPGILDAVHRIIGGRKKIRKAM